MARVIFRFPWCIGCYAIFRWMIWTQIGNKVGVLRYWNEFDIFMDDVPWQIRKLDPQDPDLHFYSVKRLDLHSKSHVRKLENRIDIFFCQKIMQSPQLENWNHWMTHKIFVLKSICCINEVYDICLMVRNYLLQWLYSLAIANMWLLFNKDQIVRIPS
jgi:hypothetical protein